MAQTNRYAKPETTGKTFDYDFEGHARVTPMDVLGRWRRGMYSPFGYLFHLLEALRREGWWYRITSVKDFCEQWEINRRTFYDAKAQLIAEGLLEEKILGIIEIRLPALSIASVRAGVRDGAQSVRGGAQGVRDGAHLASETQTEQAFCEPTDLLQTNYRSFKQSERDQGPVIDQEINNRHEIEGPRTDCEDPQTPIECQTTELVDLLIPINAESTESVDPSELSAPVSTPPSTPVQIKKSTDWENFSAPGADPEFFEFVVRKTEKFPDPPVDVRCVAESWIRKQGHVLYPQYIAWKRAMEREAPQVIDTPPPPEEIAEPTHEERLAKYQSMWQAIPCRNTVRRTIAAHPEWGITIGQSGPEMAERSSEPETCCS